VIFGDPGFGKNPRFKEYHCFYNILGGKLAFMAKSGTERAVSRNHLPVTQKHAPRRVP
jgi:hypothetical protein